MQSDSNQRWDFQLRPSLLSLILKATVIFILIVIASYILPALAILALVAVLLGVSWLTREKDPIQQIAWLEDQCWILQTAEQRYSADLMQVTAMGSWIFLRFRADRNHTLLHVCIARDQVSQDHWRMLKQLNQFKF